MNTRGTTDRDLRAVINDPVRFARGLLQSDLWPLQAEILRAVAMCPRTAVKACHASGKTFVAAVAVLSPTPPPILGLPGLCQLARVGPSSSAGSAMPYADAAAISSPRQRGTERKPLCPAWNGSRRHSWASELRRFLRNAGHGVGVSRDARSETPKTVAA
jgi:hypothetical protein